MPHRRNIVYFAIFTLLFWTIGPLMVYIVDPYHIFHETRWNKNLWFGSQTLMNLGQIETYLKRSNDYDGILVGSSHSMNFKGSDLAKAVGAKGVLKLCSSGQGLPLGCEYARQCITTGKLRYVVLVIDACFKWSSVEDKTQLIRTIPIMKHTWLCASSSECLRSILPCYMVSLGFNLDNPMFHTWYTLDNIHNWYWRKENDFISWVSHQNLSKLRRFIPKFSQYTRADVRFNESTNQRINDSTIQRFNDLLKIFRFNPEVKFYLMMPPNSWIYYKRAPRKNLITYTPYQMYDAFFFGWRHLITACADLPNVKIYGWHDCAFVSNLANYCDPGHYHPDINRYMAWCIEHDKHRLTKENYDAYEARCVGNLRAFKILDSYPHRDTFDELVAAEMQVGN